MCMNVYVCVYICMFIGCSVCVYICMFIRCSVCASVCCVPLCVYLRVCVCVRANLCLCITHICPLNEHSFNILIFTLFLSWCTYTHNTLTIHTHNIHTQYTIPHTHIIHTQYTITQIHM